MAHLDRKRDLVLRLYVRGVLDSDFSTGAANDWYDMCCMDLYFGVIWKKRIGVAGLVKGRFT